MRSAEARRVDAALADDDRPPVLRPGRQDRDDTGPAAREPRGEAHAREAECLGTPCEPAARAHGLLARPERRAATEGQAQGASSREPLEAKCLAVPRVRRDRDWEADRTLRRMHQPAEEPRLAVVEDGVDVRAGEGRGRVPEVADIEPLVTLQKPVAR